jgi:hypothetical protein
MFKNNALPFALVFFVCLFAGVSLFSGGKRDNVDMRDIVDTPLNSDGSLELPDVRGVTEVEFSVPCTLVLSQGDDESLDVDAGNSFDDEIEMTVIGNKLRIRRRDSWASRSISKYVFTLQLHGLSDLSVSGAGSVDASAFTAESLRISASGASDVAFSSIIAQSADFEVSGSSKLEFGACDAKRLSIGCSGAGDIRVSLCKSDDIDADVSGSSTVILEGTGSVEKISLELSGASDFDSERLQAIDVTAGISGGSEAIVAVSGKLVANVSGAGELRYLGSPIVDSETSGGGSVRQK